MDKRNINCKKLRNEVNKVKSIATITRLSAEENGDSISYYVTELARSMAVCVDDDKKFFDFLGSLSRLVEGEIERYRAYRK